MPLRKRLIHFKEG